MDHTKHTGVTYRELRNYNVPQVILYCHGKTSFVLY